jgi:ABC-type multidrug transport system fused ATPase/permease subunit
MPHASSHRAHHAGSAHWSRIAAVFLAVVAGSALAFLYLLLGIAFDQVRDGRTPAAGEFAAMVGVGIVGAVAVGAVPLLGGLDQPREEHRQRRRVVAQVFALGVAERTRERTGRIVSTATDAVERAATYRSTFLAPMIGSLAVPLAVLAIVALWVDRFSALVLALALPVIPLMLGTFQSIFRKVSAQYRAASRVASAQFLDAIQGLGTLRLLGAGREMGRRLAGAAENVRRHVMRLLAGNQLVLLAVDSLFSLAFVAAATILALARYDAGRISPGQALSLVLCSSLLLDPLDRVGQFFYVGMGGMASVREINGLLAQPPAVVDPAPAQAGPSGDAIGSGGAAAPIPKPPAAAGPAMGSAAGVAGSAPALELDRVTFGYDPAVPVLREASLTVAPGERVALIGPSGAGKTTVAALLQGFLRPDAGAVRLWGRDVTTVPLAWQRAQLAVVAQHTYLFTGTLRENLLIADPEADETRLWAALDASGLGGFVRALPAGLDTPVGERGLALSGGQTQRVAIARAFVAGAPILVLDEPTAHVDLAAERSILTALERLGRGRAVLTISHRPAAIVSATRVIRLADGVVTELGAPAGPVAASGSLAPAGPVAASGSSAPAGPLAGAGVDREEDRPQ